MQIIVCYVWGFIIKCTASNHWRQWGSGNVYLEIMSACVLIVRYLMRPFSLAFGKEQERQWNSTDSTICAGDKAMWHNHGHNAPCLWIQILFFFFTYSHTRLGYRMETYFCFNTWKLISVKLVAQCAEAQNTENFNSRQFKKVIQAHTFTHTLTHAVLKYHAHTQSRICRHKLGTRANPCGWTQLLDFIKETLNI